jgi:hypothetical protein
LNYAAQARAVAAHVPAERSSDIHGNVISTRQSAGSSFMNEDPNGWAGIEINLTLS